MGKARQPIDHVAVLPDQGRTGIATSRSNGLRSLKNGRVTRQTRRSVDGSSGRSAGCRTPRDSRDTVADVSKPGGGDCTPI